LASALQGTGDRREEQGFEISTANGVVPQKKSDTAASVNNHALRFIEICEKACVTEF